MTEYKDFFEFVEKSETIAVFMHINPDGDCLSAALALTRYLKNMGKNAVCYAPEFNLALLPEKLSFLPGFESVSGVEPQVKYDLCVGVDVGDEGRLGDACFKQFIKGKRTFVIDHHSSHRNFADKTIREDEAASTTQILFKMFSGFNKSFIDNDIAACLYTGLVTDSGCFSFSNTTVETHVVAGGLLGYDFDSTDICRKATKDITLNAFRLKSAVLSNVETYENERIAYVFVSEKDLIRFNATERDTEGLVNAVLDIVGVELSIAVTEVKSKSYKISFRSKGNVDASACARCFGGGGHFNASGCRAFGYYEDVHAKILEVAREMLNYA